MKLILLILIILPQMLFGNIPTVSTGDKDNDRLSLFMWLNSRSIPSEYSTEGIYIYRNRWILLNPYMNHMEGGLDRIEMIQGVQLKPGVENLKELKKELEKCNIYYRMGLLYIDDGNLYIRNILYFMDKCDEKLFDKFLELNIKGFEMILNAEIGEYITKEKIR